MKLPKTLEIDVENVDGVPTLHLMGEVDIYSAPGLETSLDDLLRQGHRQILVNLSHAYYLDSTGLGVLVSCWKQLQEQGGILALISPSPAACRALQITKLDTVLKVYATEDQAAHSMIAVAALPS